MKEILSDTASATLVDTTSEVEPIEDAHSDSERFQEQVEDAGDEQYSVDAETQTPKSELPPDIKAIFRNSVALTHPDRVRIDDPTRESKISIYLELINCSKENNIAGILLLAHKLDVDFEITDKYIALITNSINQLDAQIKNMEYITSWVWYHTDNDQLKRLMLDRIKETYRKQQFVKKNSC